MPKIKKQLSRKKKVALTITATFLLLIAVTVWIFMAIITTNKIDTYHYSGYSYTKVIKILENPTADDVKKAVLDKEYAGVCLTPCQRDGEWYIAPQTTLTEAMDVIIAYGKLLCIRLNFALSNEEQADLTATVRAYFNAREFFFWTPNQRIAESVYENNAFSIGFAGADNRFSAFLVTKMNYDVCVPVACLTEKNVSRSHKNSHYISAYGTEESMDYAKKLHADYYFTE